MFFSLITHVATKVKHIDLFLSTRLVWFPTSSFFCLMLFFLLLLAWQNMIVGLCCCCCYCCFCKFDTFSLRDPSSSITGRPHPAKKTGQEMYLSQNTNKLLPRFWPSLFYKTHFYILARCPRLASENAPDTTDSTSHLPELKKTVDDRLFSTYNIHIFTQW